MRNLNRTDLSVDFPMTKFGHCTKSAKIGQKELKHIPCNKIASKMAKVFLFLIENAFRAVK